MERHRQHRAWNKTLKKPAQNEAVCAMFQVIDSTSTFLPTNDRGGAEYINSLISPPTTVTGMLAPARSSP
jgi:hypothetical protein